MDQKWLSKVNSLIFSFAIANVSKNDYESFPKFSQNDKETIVGTCISFPLIQFDDEVRFFLPQNKILLHMLVKFPVSWSAFWFMAWDRELKQLRRRRQLHKTIDLMIKTTALHVHHAF